MIEQLHDERIVPLETAVEYLQIPRYKVIRLAKSGELKSIRVSPKIINFFVKDVKTLCWLGISNKTYR